ncbi:MAG: thioesterase family protein [Kiritimatiellae bacterium]|jgi:acyl-CoA thioester hydrolase|nr:thioesterase family protein [Kiritimatiellia bacterium]
MNKNIYKYEFKVPESVIDANEHVNNVAYVQWMQDVAIQHSTSTGATDVMNSVGASWFAHSHNIKYLSPAFLDEEIIALTWIADIQKVRSQRRYIFLRKKDNKVLARGETDWVFIDAKTGRAKKIPDEIRDLFHAVPETDEPVF